MDIDNKIFVYRYSMNSKTYNDIAAKNIKINDYVYLKFYKGFSYLKKCVITVLNNDKKL